MAKYLITHFENESEHAAQSAAAMATLIEERHAYIDELRRNGVLEDTARLRPSGRANVFESKTDNRT